MNIAKPNDTSSVMSEMIEEFVDTMEQMNGLMQDE
jgi:hypothetical protein